MSVSTMSVPTQSQIASSQCHLSRRDEWKYSRTNGVRYVSMPNSDKTRVYRVRADGRGCECRWYLTTHTICSHGLAAVEAAHHDALNEWVADQADDLLAEYDIEQRFATCGMCGANRTLDDVMNGVKCPCTTARRKMTYTEMFPSDDR